MYQAEKIIVQKLKPLLKKTDFKWNAKREKYFRKTKYGFDDFFWVADETSEKGGALLLTPFFQVRHNKVDDIVNQLGLIYGEEGRKFTTTVSRGLGYFPIDKNKDYVQRIRLGVNELDMERAVQKFASLVNQEGEEFYEKYSSLLNCSKGLNEPIESMSHPLCNNFPLRAYYGVVTAYFSEKERVPDLLAQYTQYAETISPDLYQKTKENLEKLKKLLNL